MGYKLCNGCPDSELAAVMERDRLAKLYIKDNDLRITWFPRQRVFYLAMQGSYEPIGDAFKTAEQAAEWVRNNIDKIRSGVCI